MNLFDSLQDEKSNYIITQNQSIVNDINYLLHLLEPIFSIKRFYDGIEIDIYYLSLLVFDRLISDTFYGGSLRADIVLMLQDEISSIYKLENDKSEEIAKEILDGLNNSNNKQESFKAIYYDTKERTIKKLDFRLIKYVEVGDKFYYQITDEGFMLFKIELEKDPTLALELKNYAISRLIDNKNYDRATIEIKKNINFIREYLNLLENEIRAIEKDIYTYDPNEVFFKKFENFKEFLGKPKSELSELSKKIDNAIYDEQISSENKIKLKKLQENYETYTHLMSKLSDKITEYFNKYNNKMSLKNNKLFLQKELKLNDYPKNLELFLEFFDKDSDFVDEYCLGFSNLNTPKIYNPFYFMQQICDELDNVVTNEPIKTKNIQEYKTNPNFYSKEELEFAEQYLNENIKNEIDIVALILRAKDDGLDEKIIKLLYLLAQDLCIQKDEKLTITKLKNKLNDEFFYGDNYKIRRIYE
ncbi:hypothetical protein [Campylobacter sp. MG1]|uniref:hypothetical protein n=1 Tax=Campylobacter sp. MG1 TaxID=2976332 RepID=UPI00226CBB37|nr:hypothetical protein [Campylobacter sp. MG1]